MEFSFEAEAEGKTAHLMARVRDHGCGMSKEFLQKMYEPFEQETNTFSSARRGTGLGLSIVKSIVEMMHGTISCKSKLGEGTEFLIRMSCPITETLQSVQAPGKEENRSILAGKRVLLCEDIEMNIKIERRQLEGAGILVETAINGKLGFEQFTASPKGYYDAILMDMRMPIMDGCAATRAIRASKHPDAATVPIIALTANAYAEDAEKTKAAGMDVHITKPIDTKTLYSTLEQMIAQRKTKKSEWVAIDGGAAS